jgi:hypothetical protein
MQARSICKHPICEQVLRQDLFYPGALESLLIEHAVKRYHVWDLSGHTPPEGDSGIQLPE